MKKLILLLLVLYAFQTLAQDSIVFNFGGTTATMYRNGFGKKLPQVYTGTSGKYLTNNGTTISWGSLAGGGDMLKSDNLSGLANYSTARTNLSLGNVTNESKATMFTSPTFTGTTSGITATMVGLGNVTNESKSTMFTNSTFTGTFNVADGSIANADLANGAVTNLSGTNTGDNSANSTYASDYRAANFVAGTNYLAPSGSAAALTSNTGGWTTLRVVGSNATTTGQSLVDITGLVSATLTNATLYEIEAVLYVTTTAVTTGTQYGILANGTGGAAEVFANMSGTTTTNAATTVTLSTSAAAIGTFLTTSASSGIILIKGFVLTRGTGTATISIQHLKITSGTSTVKIGSVFRYRLAQ